MDATVITESVMFISQLATKELLFGLGDLHAVMGDGSFVLRHARLPGMLQLNSNPPRICAPWPCVEARTFIYYRFR